MPHTSRLSLLLAILCLTAGSVFAEEAQWTEDFLGAQATATADDKDLLMDFTGSDWCSWCVRLDQEVFSHDAFADYANENFVLVKLDYPQRTPQDEAIREQNAQLRETYAIQGYPTILLADATGQPYAKTGYQQGGPEAYVQHLEELRAVRTTRDQKFAQAAEATGLERARLLSEGLEAMDDELVLTHYTDTIAQITELDADNEAGLKQHYADMLAAKQMRDEFQALLRANGRDAQALLGAIAEFLERDGLPADLRQQAWMITAQIQLNALRNNEAGLAALDEAIAADPESEMADRLRTARTQIQAQNAAQQQDEAQ